MLVASSQPLDQYIVRNPEFFIGASPEHARIAPDQLLILLDHVRCAAFELPFKQGDSFGGEALEEMLEYLAEQGILHQEQGCWHWMADSYPANSVSLRSVADGNFLVVDTSDGEQRVIAEVDYSAAPMTLYPEAIYMIQSSPYQVERLDWAGRKAFVRRTRADYYTDAIDYTRLKILESFERSSRASNSVAHGEVHVVRRVAGFKKIRYYSHENVGFGKVELPDQEMHTSAVWWQLTEQVLDREFAQRQQALDGFLGLAHAIHQVAVLRVMAEPQDLGRAVGDGESGWFARVDPGGRGRLVNAEGEQAADGYPDRFRPAVFIYDNYPGGVGLSAPLFDQRRQLVEQTLKLIKECDCRNGCPACIGPILVSGQQRGYSAKAAAIKIAGIFADDA